MAVKNLIAGTYGSIDHIFAGHPADIGRAAVLIVEAINEDLGLEDYIQLHKDYLKSKGCSTAHIDEQIERVKDIGSYFKND